MAPRTHAILSASSAHRWLNCSPSARLEQDFADRETEAAAEGTAAHALAEHKLRKALKLQTKKPISTYDSDEMDGHTDGYVQYVLETFYDENTYGSNAAWYIAEHFQIEQASAYRKKNRALDHLTVLLFGKF